MMSSLNIKDIDKSGWKTYRFDQIASNISERVNPKNTELKTYIGLEHLDAETVHIKRFGSPDDVAGQKLKCYPGDIIFGKRRAYQRKASVVEQEAICSAHAFVLRANPDVIDPDLLPFFLHSDLFMHRAVDISVGGLSPTVNWGTLKEQEFLLPPKKQQAQLAQLLWAMDEVIEKDLAVLEKLEDYKVTNQRKFFKNKTTFICLNEIAKIYSGGTPDRKKPEYWGGNIPWIKTTEVNYRVIKESEEYITDEGLKNSSAKLIKPNSILVAMYGQGVTRGRVGITGINATCNQACAVIEPSPNYLFEYIYYYLEFCYDDLRSLAHGANQQNLNLQMIKSFMIPKTSVDLQKEVVSVFNRGCVIKNQLKSKITTSKTLLKSLINQVF